jgi:uncharacterized protein YtpQ (UPF0354 family)
MTDPRFSLIVPVLNARVPVDVRLDFPPPAAEEPIREFITAELYVTYALDTDEQAGPARPLAMRHCAELGLLPETLRGYAIANLRARRPDLGMTWFPDARAVSITLDGDTGLRGLEAGLLLDEVLMDKLAQDIEGDLIVAVPAGDVLIATGTGHPDGLARLRATADQVWSAPGRTLLIKSLLIRRPGGWDVLPA